MVIANAAIADRFQLKSVVAFFLKIRTVPSKVTYKRLLGDIVLFLGNHHRSLMMVHTQIYGPTRTLSTPPWGFSSTAGNTAGEGTADCQPAR
jgi:hypothetical protein